MRVLGVAGHVDHGKSTLVRALTGIDPDRLKEEKARGMTIDLGFAWVDLVVAGDEGPQAETVGIVDVPGHIDFIKNMLAGVGGIDAALLVIAADEGVMPQTREHLAILDLLAVPAAVVALTKIDLVDDPDWLDLVELDVADLLETTHLASAPIVRVSATTGAGLDALRAALGETLRRLAPRRNRARPRLPIDRIFTVAGFGTVVTGTLSDGAFQVGDAVQVLPGRRSARIRSLQTHRKQVQQGAPGSRLAINLTGVGTEELRRGDVVVKPDTLQSTLLIDASVRLLPDAPRPLVHNQAVDFFTGAAETPARVRLLGAEELRPGECGWLQLRLEQPVVAAAGDRYILRQPSPSVTLGGGAVLNPHPRRRWRRFDAAALDRLRTLAQGAPDEVLLQTLARHPFVGAAELIGHAGLDVAEAEAALAELAAAGSLTALGGGPDPALATLETWERTLAALDRLLAAYHAQAPLRRGMARGELRSRLQTALALPGLPVRLFNALVEEAAQAGAAQAGVVEADDAFVWLAGFAPRLSPGQQERVDRALAAFASAPYASPNAQETLALLGGESELLELLVEQGALVRLGGGVLFRAADFDAMCEAVQAHIRSRGAITLAEARDLFDTSRKYVQALLEEMDARRITRREGESRVLRAG